MSKRTVALREQTFTVLGAPVAVGDKARFVTLTDGMTSTFRLVGDTAGKTRLISVAPSIDTGICDLQTRRMNEYVEYVPAIPQHPDYDAALHALKAVQ